jgi:hemerythrin-like metal-binding protein
VHTHFAREEAILEDTGYPDLEAHRAAHRALEDRFEALRDTYVLNPDKAAEKRVEDFLVDWLKSHILTIDMRYKDSVAAAAARHSAA